MRRLDRWLLAAMYLLLAGVMGFAATRRDREVVLASFVTSLRGRTPNQAHNAALAARSIDGKWIPPGGTFSFNRTLGPWSSDTGYKLAPVSYDGELVPSWGGGVCQASTTLYNAALLAGLSVTERHRHRWAAHYTTPGRDAAVAYPSIDLKLRNDFELPVRVEAAVHGELLEFRVVGPEALRTRHPERYAIRQDVEAVSPPEVVRQPWSEGMPALKVRNPGRSGCRVLTYRVRLRDGKEVGRELLSDDEYPPMNRVLLTDDPPPAS